MSIQERIERFRELPLVRPLLVNRYERYFRTAVDCHLFRGVFSSFSEAQASIPTAKQGGYDGQAPADMYRDDLGELRSVDYPVLFWLGRALPEIASVFDFGGHVGVKYYAYRKLFSFPESFRWKVCDVPAVAEAGTALARDKGVSQLEFVSEPREMNGYDFLLCAGSLQYVEPSLASMLKNLDRPPKHVLVNATPFTDYPEFYTVNNIGTGFCPYKIQNRERFVDDMKRAGYKVVDTWENFGKTCTIPFHPERSLDHYNGYYLRRGES